MPRKMPRVIGMDPETGNILIREDVLIYLAVGWLVLTLIGIPALAYVLTR